MSRCGQATWPTAATTSNSSATLSTARTHGLRQRAPLRASRRKRGSLVLSTSATSVPGVSLPLPVFFFLGGQSPASSGSIDASVGGPARASSAASSASRLGVIEPSRSGVGSRTTAKGSESGAGAAKSPARSAAVRVGSSADGVTACMGSVGGSATGRRARSEGGMCIAGGSGVGAATSGMATAGSGAGSGGTAGSGAAAGAGAAAGCHPGTLGRPNALPKGAGACGEAGGGKPEGTVPGATDCARAASSARRAAKRGAMVPRVATGEKEVGAGGKGRVAGVKPV